MESFQISCFLAVRIAWYLMLTLKKENMHIVLYAPLNISVCVYIYIYVYVYVYVLLQVLSSDFF